MRPIRESLRIYIRRLYFTERLSFGQIARRLDVSLETVRNAVVLDGGVSVARNTGTFHEENSK